MAAAALLPVKHKTPAAPSAAGVLVQTASPSPKSAINYGLPTRLLIPKLKVDANVAYVGLLPTGEMDVPADVTQTGWYKFGPHPGDAGSAVIAGHLDGTHGEPGVFLNLDRLAISDRLEIVNDKGETINFEVRSIKSYPQNQKPAEVFGSGTGVHLNLITCTGAWDKSSGRFSKRLVIFTDKVN